MTHSGRGVLVALVVLLCGGAYAPGGLAQNVHPIVDTGEGCLIGGLSEGKWLEADAVKTMLKGGERYRLYTLTKTVGDVVGEKPESMGEPCSETQHVKFTVRTEPGVAVGGDWNALPRVPRMTSTNDPVYRRLVAAVLRRKGFVRPKINITQVMRVDLDGDGKEEVLLSATHLAGGLGGADRGMAIHAQPGDYSFVLLRKIVGGKVRDIPLVEEYFPSKTSDPWTPNQHKVAAVLDLNGDGRMEVVLHGAYYEGSWSTVFRLDGDRVENVFGCGCGA
ncbi:MAG TPA: VCBS repeat-containing protein [Pyrinomonadaceae bacterium]|nr:VCBS repeat-containing protein [Pyrinomonadaceae bacterium]